MNRKGLGHALPLAGMMVMAAGGGEPRYGWEGTLEYRCRAEPLACLTGVGDTRWRVNVRLEEGRRIDCKDARGRLVGQFVELRDAGASDWSGSEHGYFKHEATGSITEYRYSGSGSGPGPVVSIGWMYVRMDDDDPLEEVLPNGAYALACGPTPPPAFDTQCLTTISDRGGVRSHTTPFRRLAMLQYGIGQLPLAMNPGRWPDAVLATEKKPWVSGRGMEGQDRLMRAVTNGHMQGSFQSAVAMGTSLGRERTLYREAAWDLHRVRIVRACIDEPPDYWRPQGGPDSNTVSVAAWIDPGERMKGKFRFTLSDVSREKGWCINAGNGADPDLAFVQNQPGFEAPRAEGDTWVIATTETSERAVVTIQAADYGAWGRLKAEANVDGTWRTCRTATDGATSVMLPLDRNGNRVADDWENDWDVSGQAATDDKDLEPADVGDPNEPGDGFTLYEEYRGVVVQGRWTELCPTDRDVFIRDEIGCGLGCFADLKLQAHELDAGEYDADRIVNFNRGHGTAGPQKGIRLRTGSLAGNEGEVRPCVGSPNVVTEVVIHTGSVPRKEDRAVISDSTAGLIGHELAHAVNVMHHGNDWVENARRSPLVPATDPITTDPAMIASAGGKWSGNVACPMVYDAPRFFVGSGRLLYPFPTGAIPETRSVFCKDRAGTGVNAGPAGMVDGVPRPVCGDASWGPCRQSVDIKGHHRYGDLPGW